MSRDRGRGLSRDFCTSSPGVTVISTERAAECVKKTVSPGDEVQKSLHKTLHLSRDMKQKNVIGVVACTRPTVSNPIM
jgi:hypothetical protein